MKDLRNWGFKIEEYNDRYVKYKGSTPKSKNVMLLYKIIDGIYIYDIHLNETYKVNKTTGKSKTGFRIGYCKEGTYTSNINGSNIFISTGEVFVGKSVPNALESKSLFKHSRGFNILISPHELLLDNLQDKIINIKEIIENFLSNLYELKQIGFSITNIEIVHCANDVIRALDSGDINYIKMKVFEIIYLISRFSLSKNQKEYARYDEELRDKVKMIEKDFRENYSCKLNIDEICKANNISKSKLNNCFKTLYQYSPHEYLTSIRMQKAQELLINTKMNITEVANFVGYENSSNFTRAFKRITQVSPVYYRKKHQKD